MKPSSRLLLGAAVLTAAATVSGPASLLHTLPAHAACAALGTYTVVPNGNTLAASAPPAGGFPLVVSGKATLSAYSGCGGSTLLKISTDGSGTLLRHPVTAIVGEELRSSGDILLHFDGTARPAPFAAPGTPGVQVSGTATYAEVTTKGKLRAKQQLSYKVKTVKVTNVQGQLRVISDFGGALSLNLALPGPSMGPVASKFSYFAVAARNPAKLKASHVANPKL